MPGPPPKPTALKRLAGNPGGKRLNDREPEPRREMPRCPAWLVGEARREWRRMAKELYGLGLLTVVDRAALAAYCQCWARWVKAEGELGADKVTLTITTDKGNVIQNPLVGIANTSMDQMRRFLIEFGMTPASRSRVQAAPVEREQTLEEMLLATVAAQSDAVRVVQ
jgi:P27 family predicted phage terminase small subunit